MRIIKLLSFLITITFIAACGGTPTANNTANTNTAPKPEVQKLSVVERPEKIVDMMAARGEQDKADPTLKIVEPKADATVASSTVKVKLELGGDLKGYKPGMNEETHTGQPHPRDPRQPTVRGILQPATGI